jgi:hypothetical protein
MRYFCQKKDCGCNKKGLFSVIILTQLFLHMRNLKLFLLLLIAGSIHSQSFNYYQLGQKIPNPRNACLVIKNDKITLSRLHLISKYSNIKALKLIGFKNIDNDPDNVLTEVTSLLKPHVLIFENCDLSLLTEPVAGLSELEEIWLLKNTFFSENDLFYALKNSSLQTIVVQQPVEEFETDSIYLLKNLSSVKISNAGMMNNPNKTNRIQVVSDGNIHTITITFYGNLYKNEEEVKVAEINTAQKSNIKPVSLPCIKEPIPGIDINDTVYTLSSAAGREFYYESGSKISIDKDAFVTLNGNNYQGPVQLFYREFRNPVEIMLSGIPMKNTVNGEEQLFQSGGMYQINAFDNSGNELKTRSDTSVKINFALTDTSSEFGFYSLNDNGSWVLTSDKVASSTNNPNPSDLKRSRTETKAVKEYYLFVQKVLSYRNDTTRFSNRFDSDKYLYTYRKDNLEKSRDSVNYVFERSRDGRAKGLFRVKYLRSTKEKEIIFTILPDKRAPYYVIPRYVQALTNKTYVYTGDMTKEEFRKKFSYKIKCWDLRPDFSGALEIKTKSERINLPCMPVYLVDGGKRYVVSEKENSALNKRLKRAIAWEAKMFDKKLFNRRKRDAWPLYNDPKGDRNTKKIEQEAFAYCKQFQTQEEFSMSFDQWKDYVNTFTGGQSEFIINNDVATALVKSGMGIKNIDAYIHKGQVETMYVNYKASPDTLLADYYAVLYSSINTSYSLSRSFGEYAVQGFFFKKKPNYLIRLSKDGYMQVIKPKELALAKRGDRFVVEYQSQYMVKGMDSREISRLILD